MAKVQVKLASASRKELFFALDSASTTGAGKTGASGTMVAYYVRNETTPTATLIASPAFTEVSSANMPGVYYLTVPVGAFAAGATTCAVMITGTGIAPVLMEYQLVAFDPDSATNLGLAALPTASPNAANGFITNGSGTGQLTVSGGVASSNTTQWNGTTVTALPSGFLSTAFPTGTVASTTNITAGTIQTVSGNVNGSVNSVASAVTVGTINAGVITNASIADSAITIRLDTDGTASKARLVSGTTASDVWNALTASYAVNNSFGQRILRSSTSQATCQVTGSNHIAADIHELQPLVISAGDFADNALVIQGATGTGVKAYLASDSITSTVIANNAIDAAAIASDADEAIADAILGRNVAGGSNSGRLVKEALYALRNKSEIIGSTLNVYNATDGAVAWSATVSSSGTAVPVTGIDPP